jgi:hypothetical protein
MKTQGIEKGFEECLSDSKDAFVLMRYHFEEEADATNKGWIAGDIREAVRHHIRKPRASLMNTESVWGFTR